MRVKPEKVTGVVALSYLVLIPAFGAWVYARIQSSERDIDILWDTISVPQERSSRIATLNDKARQVFGR